MRSLVGETFVFFMPCFWLADVFLMFVSLVEQSSRSSGNVFYFILKRSKSFVLIRKVFPGRFGPPAEENQEESTDSLLCSEALGSEERPRTINKSITRR